MAVSMLAYQRPSMHNSLPQVLHTCFLPANLKTPSFLLLDMCSNPRPGLPLLQSSCHPAALMCFRLFTLSRPTSALTPQSFLLMFAKSWSLVSSAAHMSASSDSLALSSAQAKASSAVKLAMVSEGSSQ